MWHKVEQGKITGDDEPKRRSAGVYIRTNADVICWADATFGASTHSPSTFSEHPYIISAEVILFFCKIWWSSSKSSFKLSATSGVWAQDERREMGLDKASCLGENECSQTTMEINSNLKNTSIHGGSRLWLHLLYGFSIEKRPEAKKRSLGWGLIWMESKFRANPKRTQIESMQNTSEVWGSQDGIYLVNPPEQKDAHGCCAMFSVYRNMRDATLQRWAKVQGDQSTIDSSILRKE